MEVTSIPTFVSYWEKVHARTARVIDLIPHDRYGWRPAEGAFSFADLIRHLAAIERYMFAENACGRWSSYPGHGAELADGADQVMQFYRASHAQSVELVRALQDSDLQLPCTTPGGATMSRGKWLRAMIEHEAHHRGQLYLMLKMIGIATPPLYGLTSEEVLARSRDGDA